MKWLPLLILLATPGLAAAQAQGERMDPNLSSLVAAERAFSATTVEEGFRDSFLKFFADDGVNFGPEPQNTRKVLSALPPAKGPRKMIFRWAPVFADVSAAGDLGYTTGPVLYESAPPERKVLSHGIYFSVWQKQQSGEWKVVLDLGGPVPSAIAPIDAPLKPAKPLRRVPARSGKPVEPKDLDENFTAEIAAKGRLKAYLNSLAPEFRIHRSGVLPTIDRSVLPGLKTLPTSFQFIGGRASRSREFVYTYGKYFADGGEEGYYIHVWRLNANGKWRLAIEVESPLEKEAQ